MNLIRAKTWLGRHKKWRATITAQMGITRVADLNALNEKYTRMIQANAMQWCLGKTDPEIKHRMKGLLL